MYCNLDLMCGHEGRHTKDCLEQVVEQCHAEFAKYKRAVEAVLGLLVRQYDGKFYMDMEQVVAALNGALEAE